MKNKETELEKWWSVISTSFGSVSNYVGSYSNSIIIS